MKTLSFLLAPFHKYKSAKTLLGMVIFLLLTAGLASLFQSDFGTIDIQTVKVVDENGLSITGKIFIPKTATQDSPAPGVILCHGMNNDKETESTVALELARQGLVALTIDQVNHGDSDIGGSALSFLETSEDNDTLGANAMYHYLESASFVDNENIGVIGHSMGGSTARTLAKLNPDHRAVVIQAGGPDNLSDVSWMHNYLDIWPIYEELFINSLESRADFLARGKNIITYNTALIGETPRDKYYDETYGNFAAGTAQRYALCQCTHPGSTWNQKSIQETVAWMLQALKGVPAVDAIERASHQTYLIKEYLLLCATITLFLLVIPIIDLYLQFQPFTALKQPIPTNVPLKGKEWRKAAIINTLIGGITFIICPGIGMVLGAVITIVIPIFRLLTGNGSLFWLLVNAWIAQRMLKKWWARQPKEQKAQLGFFDPTPTTDQKIYLRNTFLITAMVFGLLYGMVALIQNYFFVELRFMWPVFKEFTPLRFALFLVYLYPVSIFFKINGGEVMFGQLRMAENSTGWKTQLIWWSKYIFAMEGGLFFIFCIQYLPMFIAQTGPGFSFGLMIFLFGLFGIFLMQVLPQFAVIFFVMVAIYRRTGKPYLGSYVATMLTTWIIAVSGMLV